LELPKQLVELTVKCTYKSSGTHDDALAFARTITVEDLGQIKFLDIDASMIVLDVQVSPVDAVKPATGITHDVGTSDSNPPMTDAG